MRACKVFAQAFFKKLAVSKGSALVAFRRKRNLLNGAFLFAKLFLLRLVCQKKKRYRRRILLVGVGALDDPCKTQGYLYKRR